MTFTGYDGAQTLYRYDEKNRVVSVTDPEGQATAYTYAGSEALPETDPLGHVTAKAYNRKGWLLTETDAAGKTTGYTYDPAGAVTTITDRNGGTGIFTYDRRNRMLSGRDPLGNILTYTYDAAGNKLTETDAEGYVTSYTYDAMGRVVEVRGPVKEAMETAGQPGIRRRSFPEMGLRRRNLASTTWISLDRKQRQTGIATRMSKRLGRKLPQMLMRRLLPHVTFTTVQTGS